MVSTADATLGVAVATVALALATIYLGFLARESGQNTKKLAEAAGEQVKALQEQNGILKEQFSLLKDQFEASIRPALLIYPAGTTSGGLTVFDVVVANHGGGIAKNVHTTVRREGEPSSTLATPVLRPGEEQRIPILFSIAGATRIWTVSVTGVKDVLDRPVPDIVDFPVEYPPRPLSP